MRDAEAGTVEITDPETRLDVGAVAKGYATEQVCKGLPEGYLVSVGGNVRATGPKPDGTPWVDVYKRQRPILAGQSM